jgi:SP family arabinose:H+ symporter-like MFS transporter
MFVSSALSFMILLLKVPQPSRSLAEEGRIEEAFQILARIKGEDQSKKELNEIRKSLAGEIGTFAELFEPGTRRALFVGIVLALFNNWTGWTGLACYSPFLFQQSGYPHAATAIGINVLIMGGTVILTAISIWLVDRVGGRPIWLVTSVAMFFCIVAAGFVFQSHIEVPTAVAVIFFCAAPRAIGLGRLPWLMMSEYYPRRIRARAVSITTTFLWIAGFTAPFAFPILEAASKRVLGTGAGVFWFYSMICVLSFLWALKFLPETKGRSLKEIADSWRTQTFQRK